MSALSCPTCAVSLFASPTRPGVHGCGTCGGVWADNETTRLIAAVLDPELVDLADRAEQRHADGQPLPADAPGARGCPACRAQLVRVNVAATNLDVCSLHGTWFDRGELQRVSRRLDADRTLQIPRTDQGPGRWVMGSTQLNVTRAPDRDEGGSLATDVAFGLLLGIIDAAFRGDDD